MPISTAMISGVMVALVAVVSCVLVRFYIGFARTHRLFDLPNERSSHTVATPRGGGAAIFLVWTLSLLLAAIILPFDSDVLLALVGGSAIIAVVGFLDDVRSLKARTRILAHLAASLLCVGLVLLNFTKLDLGFTAWPLGILGPVLATITMVWSINLFNFMDGMDGLAGSEAIWTCSIGGLGLWRADAQSLALCSWLVAAAAAGFFVWNKPKAKIFMGDVGSGFLGFLIAAIALIGEARCGFPVLVWVILYGAFIFDATITLLRRMVNGERWYGAHRSHAYQRLHHSLGWSHARVLAAISCVNLVLAGLALWAIYDRHIVAMALGSALLFLASLYALVERVAPMTTTRQRRQVTSMKGTAGSGEEA